MKPIHNPSTINGGPIIIVGDPPTGEPRSIVIEMRTGVLGHKPTPATCSRGGVNCKVFI